LLSSKIVDNGHKREKKVEKDPHQKKKKKKRILIKAKQSEEKFLFSLLHTSSPDSKVSQVKGGD